MRRPGGKTGQLGAHAVRLDGLHQPLQQAHRLGSSLSESGSGEGQGKGSAVDERRLAAKTRPAARHAGRGVHTSNSGSAKAGEARLGGGVG